MGNAEFAAHMGHTVQIHENFSLQPFNTFGLDVRAHRLVQVSSLVQLQEAIAWARAAGLPWMVLGGGSNVLFTGDYPGLLIHLQLQGLDIVEETDAEVQLRVAAGENWHATVCHCVNQNWGGIENLSLIPGLAGAAPIQNIGAYGVEIKDVLRSVEVLLPHEGSVRTFSLAECELGYRDSIFKRELAGRAIVLSLVIALQKQPVLNTSYGAISEELARTGKTEFTIADVSAAVIRIRSSKLPDPKEIGNAGSFFKNPEITESQFMNLKAAYPAMPSYDAGPGLKKVPAAWLIEQAGWKGRRFGNYGVHEKQALVLVNYGGASGADILQLSKEIQQSVEARFGISLVREVNVV